MKSANIVFKILGYGIILGGLLLLTYYAICPTESYQSEYREYYNSSEGSNNHSENFTSQKYIENKKAEINNEKHKSVPMPSKKEKSTIKNDKNTPTKADKIIGVWEVKNEYYMAIYEVEKHQDKYIGKIHYYNDGKTEYRGKNAKEDYFLDGVTYENGMYKNGKMYMPYGSNYQVIFKLKSNDELDVKMTVQGSPYTEIWKRQEN